MPLPAPCPASSREEPTAVAGRRIVADSLALGRALVADREVAAVPAVDMEVAVGRTCLAAAGRTLVAVGLCYLVGIPCLWPSTLF